MEARGKRKGQTVENRIGRPYVFFPPSSAGFDQENTLDCLSCCQTHTHTHKSVHKFTQALWWIRNISVREREAYKQTCDKCFRSPSRNLRLICDLLPSLYLNESFTLTVCTVYVQCIQSDSHAGFLSNADQRLHQYLSVAGLRLFSGRYLLLYVALAPIIVGCCIIW